MLFRFSHHYRRLKKRLVFYLLVVLNLGSALSFFKQMQFFKDFYDSIINDWDLLQKSWTQAAFILSPLEEMISVAGLLLEEIIKFYRYVVYSFFDAIFHVHIDRTLIDCACFLLLTGKATEWIMRKHRRQANDRFKRAWSMSSHILALDEQDHRKSKIIASIGDAIQSNKINLIMLDFFYSVFPDKIPNNEINHSKRPTTVEITDAVFRTLFVRKTWEAEFLFRIDKLMVRLIIAFLLFSVVEFDLIYSAFGGK